MSQDLITDWVCVATEGKTIDGRVIKASWLQDIAKTYDTNTYQALIWPYHDKMENRNWTPNYGLVDSVKLSIKNGKTKLLARLIPNKFLLDANKNKQKLFTSIELADDPTGVAECYLAGIAVTDTPASLETSRLQFSAISGNTEPLEFTVMKREKSSFWQNVFSSKTKQTEDNAMDKEQFSQLMGKLDEQKAEFEAKFSAQEQKLDALSGKVNTFSQQPAPEEKPTEKTTEKPQEPAPSAPENENKAFQAILTKMDTFSNQMGELDKRFSALEKQAITPLPSNQPVGEHGDIFI